MVEGYFDAKSNGHLGVFGGAIRDVHRMVRLRSRSVAKT
jgi:hypothetical protein